MMKSAAEVEREVEASRGALDRTVDALKEKMTPGQLFDEASRMMGGAGQQVASKFLEQAKDNPMPLAVMGLGLAWLMTSNQHSAGPGSSRAYSNPYERAAFTPESSNGVSDKLHAAADKAAELTSGSRDKVADMAAGATDATRRALHELTGAASGVGGEASRYAHSAQRSFMQLLESEPLLLGAAGLLVGAAIGAALPSTEAEDKLVGGMRDDLFEKGKSLAETGMQKAGGAARAAYDELKSELQQSADSGGNLDDRTEGAVGRETEARREGLQGPPS